MLARRRDRQQPRGRRRRWPRELVRAAADAGAHAVKLQTFRAERFVRRRDERRFAQLERFELARRRRARAGRAGAGARARRSSRRRSTSPSVDLLEPLVDALKIASGDNDFFPLVRRVAATGKPVVAVDRRERPRAHRPRARRGAGGPRRPARRRGAALRERLPRAAGGREPGGDPAGSPSGCRCPVGYSDHTLGLDAAPLAVALGARIIEKHFTLEGTTPTSATTSCR